MKSLSFLLSQTPQMGWQKDMFAPPRLSVGGGATCPPCPPPPPPASAATAWYAHLTARIYFSGVLSDAFCVRWGEAGGASAGG